MPVILRARLLTQRRLYENRGAMTAVWLLRTLFCAVNAVGAVVSVRMLMQLARAPEAFSTPVFIALCALFSLGTVFSVALYALAGVCAERWFFQNARFPQRVRTYFARFSLRETCVYIYSFWLRRVLAGLRLLAYLSPGLAGAAVLWLTLRAEGLPAPLLFCALAALALAQLFGAYFGFADAQRYLLFAGRLLFDSACGVPEALRAGRAQARALSFSCARERLRFLPWLLSCVLVLPLFYVAPYRRQSLGSLQYLVCEGAGTARRADKPVVFFCAAKRAAAPDFSVALSEKKAYDNRKMRADKTGFRPSF